MYTFKVIHCTYVCTIPCPQSIPVHSEGHVHTPGAVQFPPLKQPVEHTAIIVNELINKI